MDLMQHTRTEDLRFVLWREMQIRPEVRGSTSIEIDLHAFPKCNLPENRGRASISQLKKCDEVLKRSPERGVGR